MARHGEWPDRWGAEREPERWRREYRDRDDEGWRYESDADFGREGERREWHLTSPRRGRAPGGLEDRWTRYDARYDRRPDPMDERWEGRGSSRGGWEPQGAHERWPVSSRATMQRDDRGPLQWLGDAIAEKVRPRGPKGYRRSDERIREDVCECIARSGLNAEEVEVKVEGGEVTLTGTVDSRHDKRRLEDMVDDVFGVDDVHNHLRVSPPAQQAGTGGHVGAVGSHSSPDRDRTRH
jgi:hypothetical protein